MTRLFYERMITQEFPKLMWIRVCTSAPNTITVYACDENLELDENIVSDMKHFLSEMGLASCSHKVMHYFELRNANVFPIAQIPDNLKQVALKGKVNRAGVQAALKSAFPLVDPEHLEVSKDVVTFHLLKYENWTPHQVEFAEQMLSEILPAGSTAKLIPGPSGT